MVQLTPHLDKYPNADLVWAQEEVGILCCVVQTGR
jgi:hypothetical protein